LKKGKVLTVLLSTLITLLIPLTSAAEDDKEILDIATAPSSILMDVTDMKPGDYLKRDLTVINKGEKDFTYTFSNEFIDGSTKLYNEFLLIVKDSQGTLFDGKLMDFEKLDPRKLNSGESEVLTFYVEMPYELGNEYQGLSTKFQFTLYVEGEDGGAIPVDKELPNTATQMYNFLTIGIILLLGGSILYFIQRKKRISRTDHN
jgi:LPXTG-motif cell wall-anchored protein